MPAVNAQGGVRDAQSRPCQETSRVSGSRHWKAQCHESGTLRLGRGRRKRAGDSTSPAAYSTWGGADGKGLQPVAPRRRPTLLERGGGDGNTASLPDSIRQYPSAQSKTGRKVRITPSKASITALREKVRAVWQRNRGAPVAAVIRDLNRIIRGWANYFRISIASRVFSGLDNWMFRKAVRWVNWTHPHKPNAWRRARYWGRFHPTRADGWVFGNKDNGAYLLKFKWFKIERHVIVRGTASPDDPTLRAYWATRQRARVRSLTPSRQRIAHGKMRSARSAGTRSSTTKSYRSTTRYRAHKEGQMRTPTWNSCITTAINTCIRAPVDRNDRQ